MVLSVNLYLEQLKIVSSPLPWDIVWVMCSLYVNAFEIYQHYSACCVLFTLCISWFYSLFGCGWGRNPLHHKKSQHMITERSSLLVSSPLLSHAVMLPPTAPPSFLSGSGWIHSLCPRYVCQALRWADSEWCLSSHFSYAGGHFEQMLPFCPVSCVWLLWFGTKDNCQGPTWQTVCLFMLAVLCAKTKFVGILWEDFW